MHLGRPFTPPGPLAWIHSSVGTATRGDSHLRPPRLSIRRGSCGLSLGRSSRRPVLPHPQYPPIPICGATTHDVSKTHLHLPSTWVPLFRVNCSMSALPTVSRGLLSLWPKTASLMLPGTPCSEIRLALSTKGKGRGTEFSVHPGAVKHVGEEGGAHLVSGFSSGECEGPKQHWKKQLPCLCGLPLPCWTDAFPPLSGSCSC